MPQVLTAAASPTEQAPAVQVAAGLVREQLLPQVPQLVRVLSAASQPLAEVPSQLPKPGGVGRRGREVACIGVEQQRGHWHRTNAIPACPQ